MAVMAVPPRVSLSLLLLFLVAGDSRMALFAECPV